MSVIVLLAKNAVCERQALGRQENCLKETFKFEHIMLT